MPPIAIGGGDPKIGDGARFGGWPPNNSNGLWGNRGWTIAPAKVSWNTFGKPCIPNCIGRI
jgi:hypothetical protein